MASRPASASGEQDPPAVTTRRRRGWDGHAATTAVVAASIIGIVLRRALAGEVLFRRDVHLMWYAQVEAFVRAVIAGEWPLWNPAIGFGQPLWADANVQVLYPPTWLNLLVRPWTYYTAFVVAHLLLAALGGRALARALGLGPRAAAVAGLLWMASGPVLSMADVWNQLAGAGWMAWALAAGVRMLRSGRARSALATGAALAAQIVAGSPEAVLLTGAGLVAYALVAHPWRATGRAPSATAATSASGSRVARAAILSVAVALGLSAAQWVPSAAAAAESGRLHLSGEAQGYWSVPPAGLIQMALPTGADVLPLQPPVAARLFGGHDPLLPSLYLGLGTVILAVAAFAGPRPREAALLLLLFALGLAVALGPHLFVHRVLIALVPPLRALRYPVKAMPAAALSWALLCALGFESWAAETTTAYAGDRRRRTAVLLVAAAVPAAAASAAAIALSSWPEAIAARLLVAGSILSPAARLAPARETLAVATIAGLAIVALVIAYARGRIAATTAALATVAVALADLTAAHAHLVPTAPRALYTIRPGLLEAARPPEAGRLYTYDYFVPGRSETYLGRSEPFAIARAPVGWSVPAASALAMRLSLFPPTSTPWGIAGSFDHDTPEIAPRRSALLLERLVALEGSPAHTRLLALGGVSRVLALHARGLEDLPLLATGDALLPEPARVTSVPGARPRAWAVRSARVVRDDGEALGALVDPGFEPAEQVLLAEGSPAAAAPARPFRSSVSVARVGADRMLLRARLGGDGYVVVADAWTPGWTARVDGRTAAVLRANVGFRALGVPSGVHDIELRYWPPGLTAGLAITAIALAAIAIGSTLVRGGAGREGAS